MGSAKRRSNEESLARGLGWFSIGLGLAAVLAPRGVARLIGVRGYHGLIRLVGFREITSGIGILARSQPTPWVDARVAGDAMDLGLLGAAFSQTGSDVNRLATATAAVAGVAAMDVLCSTRLHRHERGLDPFIHITKSIAINKPREELYQFWREFQNLPRFMRHLKSVRFIGERRSHWVAKGPAGSEVEWDAEITEERNNEYIAWRSLEGADVQNSGSVRFEPGPKERGSIVTVELHYKPPGGRLAAKFAKLFGEEPEQQVNEDLRRFRQLLETGEIPTTEGQSAGRKSSTSPKFDKFARSLAEA